MPELATHNTVHLDAATVVRLSAPESTGQFHWELIAAPDGSASSLIGSREIQAQFTADVPGRYLFRLSATTTRGLTHHVIRLCVDEYGSIGLTTLEIKASSTN